MMNKITIEVCANSVESALIAQQAGAHRIELCASMYEGGTTPSFGEIKTARELLSTARLHVIVRPRGGDFVYSPLEQDIMIQDIKMCEQLGVDGVVLGGLTTDGEIDIPLMQKLMAYIGKMRITFHRAFDMCCNPQKAVEQIIEIGCDSILTSGQENTAEKGIPLLKELVKQACGRIRIMPGGGVNADNIVAIAAKTGACEFHLSGRSVIQSTMIYRNPKISMGKIGNIDEYAREVTDLQKIKATLLSSNKLRYGGEA